MNGDVETHGSTGSILCETPSFSVSTVLAGDRHHLGLHAQVELQLSDELIGSVQRPSVMPPHPLAVALKGFDRQFTRPSSVESLAKRSGRAGLGELSSGWCRT
jgi:hypothetical protein